MLRKSIHQKLLDLYIEETGKQQDDQKLQCNTHLLRKLVRREKLNCLILNLYPGNEGYSLMLRSKAGIETETCKLPYELPPFLVDVLEKAQVNVFYSGCVIVEIRDFRRATNGTFDMQYVLLKPNPQTLLCDINNLTSDGHVWTQEDLYMLEGKLLLATEEPLCLDPSPAVALVANRQQYDRNKLNTPQLKRPVKKYTQAAMNRKRKFALNFWKQKAVSLVPPDSVDVDKFARVMDKPDKRLIMENSLALVEEQVLERDGVQDKKLLAKLTIYHRPLDDAHIGELYLDHDYVEDKSKGATCRYLDQFREIFTEEGRRAVKITTQRPGQPPQVTCTQTTPTNLPVTSVPGSAMEVSPVAGMGGVGMKRTMPIQLALSIGPTGTPNPPGQAVFTQQGDGSASASSTPTVSHPQQQQQQQQQQQAAPQGGVVNINLGNSSNITGIPPNINIQNLTGLPGMNIANLQGLQNMQGGTPSMQGHQQGVISQGGSNVMSGTGMLSVPINLGPGLVQQGLKSAGQIRASSSMPLQLQFGQQGIQFVNLQQQRTTLKPGAGLQPGQTLGTMGVRPSTSIQGPLTTTILSNPGLSGGQQVLSHLSLQGKPGPGGGITTTLTPQQLVQLQPQFQIQQTFQRSGLQQATGQPTQQLQFHQILKQQPPQSPMTFGGKPKAKKRTTPTPPKQ
ncbi:SP20H-like protein [Mya arenaria]|uniref:SP20H-like protein n=1 Tax=Mya arenaria TaxID=6604 RepID=A0ABY7DSJ0_MYAAR|nr:SP20H-like protein [Mya arenaria]